MNIKWGLIDYPTITENDYELVLLSQQRILDYTGENVIENAADPDQMRQTFEFYSDAKVCQLDGYTMLYQDEFGVAFIRNDLYASYFDDE